MGRQGTGNKKRNSEAQDRQEEDKNRMGNGEDTELIYTPHGQGGGTLEGWVVQGQGA